MKITGLGPVTPAGIGREAFARGINESISRVRVVERLLDQGQFIAAEVPDFRLSDWITVDGSMKRLARHTQFALAGTALALADAGLAASDLAGCNPAIVNGSTLMDLESIYRTMVNTATKGPRYAVPTAVVDSQQIAVPARIAEWLDTPARVISLQTACCSGLDAIGHAAELIATGQTDIALCSGTECPVLYHPMLELGMTRLSPQNSNAPASMGRPFDLWRSTGVIGEGAAVLLLESECSPRPAYAWVCGYAYCCDAAGVSGNGMTEAMRMALANARRNAADVDFINAWGPGHETVDRVEAQCLREIFGDRLSEIATVSLKGAIGNPLGAAGAIQAASVCLSFRSGIVPPTVNWETPDPDCPLNLSNRARDIQPRVALINAHGLGGSNASLVLAAS
ncbi:beta-ketoacyl-[acyl-carrier-protein] synthase family protein [Oleiharenicola sp. Vm1]|uniref:beta-ketoacyl-[acyl-carrier-protein] synthase family protein n=1 Tax=Oleiharenicola sp. Vm1 TaxID=3398393 RepID=UPI0039F495FF